MIAVSLFDYTGNMLRPWAEAGYECWCLDVQHKGVTDERVGEGVIVKSHEDLLTTPRLPDEQIAFVSAFPPCTHLSVSGARWFKGKGLRALQESIAFFATAAEFCEASGAPYLIENPMSTISTYWREPDRKFHPCQYSGYVGGDENYTKETWLWTGGGFVMPPMNMGNDLFTEPDRTYIHHQPPGEKRANIRSATPMGFARAVFESNHKRMAA